MHEETTVTAVFAVQAEGGPWIGPHDALSPGRYTSATIGFTAGNAPAAESAFAGKVIHVRFGEWPKEQVAEVAPTARLSDGSTVRVRLTHDIEDVLFRDDWIAPVCRGTLTLNNAIADDADVDSALRSAALDAANALKIRAAAEIAPGATTASKTAAEAAFVETVRAALAVAGATEKTTASADAAMKRLAGSVHDYDGRPGAAPSL